MSLIRISKEFDFEMAHVLWNYKGACKNIHGHSYKLIVTVAGKPIEDVDNTCLGMVMDFKILKDIVNKQIIDKFDHALVVNGNSPHRNLEEYKDLPAKLVLFPKQPTCENLILEFVERIKEYLPKEVSLDKLRLYETATSYAEWCATKTSH